MLISTQQAFYWTLFIINKLWIELEGAWLVELHHSLDKSQKRFPNETTTCRDGTQPNKIGMTPQHTHTIPTSCAILYSDSLQVGNHTCSSKHGIHNNSTMLPHQQHEIVSDMLRKRMNIWYINEAPPLVAHQSQWRAQNTGRDGMGLAWVNNVYTHPE